ncbi:PRD domain-containing protein [Alkaliphilus crotonatoxidans]
MDKYVITKILSNNVVLVENEQNNYVFVGKGIGFGRKKGDTLDSLKEIEQKFISLEGLKDDEYDGFFDTVDPRIIELCKKINELVEAELGQDLSAGINIGLIDHINFAIKRLKEGVEIVNPFLYETKLLYPLEYSLALRAVMMLKEKLNMDIPEAEVGFLALHFHGGMGAGDKTRALEHSMVMNKMLHYVEERLGIHLERDSFEYKRFLMHLSGVINRAEKKEKLINTCLFKLKEDLAIEYKIAWDLSKMIQNALKLTIKEEELIFMAIHIHKLSGMENRKEGTK